MKNIGTYISFKKWTLWHLFIEGGLCLLLLLSCSSNNDEIQKVVPDNWVTLSTEPMEFTYEGGTECRQVVWGEGVDASQVEVNYGAYGEEWLTATLDGNMLKVCCEHSFVERNRTCNVTLKLDDKHKCSLPISQAAAPASDDRPIKVVSGVATSEMEKQPITESFDGDKSTYFNSVAGAVTYPFYMTYELEAGHTLYRIVYTPRTDGGNKWGSFDEFAVEVSTADKPDEFRKVGEYARGNKVHTPFNMDLAEIPNVAKVRFVINKAYKNRVSCAEMEFFEPSSNRFDISSIFADELGTKLVAGVTDKQIKQIPNENLRSLALALWEGNYDTRYRLADYRPYQNPDVMAVMNKTNKYSLRDNVTGIYARPGEKLAVFVGKIYPGGKISILIQDLNGGYNNFRTIDLKEGYNEVVTDIGGLIYVLNHVESDIPLLLEEADEAQKKEIADKTVTVHFGNGAVNGYFDLAKNTNAEWTSMLANAKYKDIDVLGKYAHVTWTTEDFRTNATTDIVSVIKNFDRLVWLEEDFIGLIKYDKMFNNRMHFSVDYATNSPNATDYRTVYSDGKTYAELFCVPSRFAARLWGPAHEAGHVNQTRPGMKWAGTTEITNNILSLHVQTSFGQPCKLLVDQIDPKDENGQSLGKCQIYEAARKLIVDGKRPHALGGGNEVRLVPFWQLKLYLIDVLGKKDFYRDLFEYYRTHPSPSNLGENSGMDQLDFVRQTCNMAQLNLLDFFIKWGFLTPVNDTLDDYGKKNFVITQQQVNDLKAEIKAKNYPDAAPNLHLITEDNMNSYK